MDFRKLLEAGFAQVNPFDNGADFKSVMRQPASTTKATGQQRPAPARTPAPGQPRGRVASRPTFNPAKGFASIPESFADFTTEMLPNVGKGAVAALQGVARAPETIVRSVAGLPFADKHQDLLTSNKVAGIPGTEGLAKAVYGDQPIKTYQQQTRELGQAARSSSNPNIRSAAPLAPFAAPLLAAGDATALSGVTAGAGAVAKRAPAASQSVVRAAKTANTALERTNPRVAALDEARANMQRAFDVETNATRRAQINEGLAQLNQERQALTQGGYVKVPVTKRGGEKQVPVSKVETDGQFATKTNLKTGKEQRFTLDEKGELLPDRKGAYRIWTDDEGHVKQIRVGDEVLTKEQLGDLGDVTGYGSTLATMRRNVERGFGKDTSDKLSRTLVDHQQEAATKMISRASQLRGDLGKLSDDLGLHFATRPGHAKKVSAAIQDFGEKKITKADLDKQFGKDYADKIVQADKYFRSQYDSLLDEANTTLTKYGLEPIPKRDNYYTHFQDENVWRNFGLKMQDLANRNGSPTLQDSAPGAARGKISNQLAGESEFTQPNKRFNPFAQKREGGEYTSDAFQAFERYLNPTLNNIYMTPAISRTRAVAKGVAQEADLAGKDANAVLIQMKEWANDLAGKSNRFDRPLVDSNWGQKYLKAAQWAQRRVGANSIVGNLSTAVLQPIVLSQTTGKFGLSNTLLATMQTIQGKAGKAGPIAKSQFLARRYANDRPVTANAVQVAADAANQPLYQIERASAEITWNAAHNSALSKGLKGKEAIRYADIEAEKTLAGRAIGERPEAFRSKGAGFLTMYQLEVNNFWQQFAKEMTPQEAGKTLVAVFAFNEVLKAATGRQVGFNPIDVAFDAKDIALDSEKDDATKGKEIAQRGLGEFVDNVPFVGPLANATVGDKNIKEWLGDDTNAGRFGVASPLAALIDNPWYAVTPFGGAQAKKTIESLQGFERGYAQTPSNRATFAMDGSNPLDVVRGLAFGKNAVGTAQEYYDNDRSPLGTKQTASLSGKNQDAIASTMNDIFGKRERGEDALVNTKTKKAKKNQTYADKYKTAEEDFKKNSATWSPVTRLKKEKELAKLTIQKDYDNDSVSLYGLNKTDALKLIAQDGKLGEKAVAYGDALVDAGLEKYNKLRSWLGLGTGGKKTASKGKGGKGRKKATFKPTKTANAGINDTSKRLGSLLANAKVRKG